MSTIDWIIMLFTLVGIIIYGIYKSKNQDATSYMVASRQMPWHIVLLGIMATQASAITFISGPGQAYSDGMRFLQYYFGLPLAMIVIAWVFVPLYQKLQVKTAYEFLEQRFDLNTRLFTGILFLLSRGISTGMSVYAPAIVLSTIFHWDIYITIVIITCFMLIYTYLGGANAIAHTQKLQFSIIIGAMILATYFIIKSFPANMSVNDALHIAGANNKLNIITTTFDWKDKYNIYSGIIGGFFLALSYFGTDNSQVGRYIGGKNERESKLGLLMNGFVKIPMQFFILMIGILLFSYYSLRPSPIFFNERAEHKVATEFPETFQKLENIHQYYEEELQKKYSQLKDENYQPSDSTIYSDILSIQKAKTSNKNNFKNIIEKNTDIIGTSADDTNYVFLHFVKNNLPIGTIGIIFCIIFLASWSSISAALNSLATSTLLDFHLIIKKSQMNDNQQLRWSKRYTLFWGIFSMVIAFFATKMKSLIEAVNELGSLFYGPILGIFLIAFFFKKVKGKATLYAGILSEMIVLVVYYIDIVGFLWLNVIGALSVVILGILVQNIKKTNVATSQAD
jgi:SSS family solute:Na+ symporter